jgi:Cyclic nucleotide-binding domain
MSARTSYDLDKLSHFALFRDLTVEQWREFSDVLHSKTFSAGSTLMTVEQPGEVVYFILSGTVKVHVEQEDGRDVIISILGPGECVGEMSPLDQVGRSASVVTIEESELLWLDHAMFRRFLLQIPAFAYNLACVCLRGCGWQTSRFRRSPRTKPKAGLRARYLLSPKGTGNNSRTAICTFPFA